MLLEGRKRKGGEDSWELSTRSALPCSGERCPGALRLVHWCTVCQCFGALVLWCFGAAHILSCSRSQSSTHERDSLLQPYTISNTLQHKLEHIATQSHQPYKTLCVRNTRSAKSRHSRCSCRIIEPMNLLSNNQLTIV